MQTSGGHNSINFDQQITKFTETIQIQREHLEECVLECEERQLSLETVEEEIISRATDIAEKIEILK